MAASATTGRWKDIVLAWTRRMNNELSCIRVQCGGALFCKPSAAYCHKFYRAQYLPSEKQSGSNLEGGI